MNINTVKGIYYLHVSMTHISLFSYECNIPWNYLKRKSICPIVHPDILQNIISY